jgi:hypothetical protein
MTLLPRSNPFRPDFEAPGPQVHVEKNNGIDFEERHFRDPLDDEDEDDEFSSYRYYESNKVLGKLYRAIDEREIFGHIQKRAAAEGIARQSSVLEEVWKYVLGKVQGIQWEYLLEWAQGIRAM